jgi:hypothetical protein
MVRPDSDNASVYNLVDIPADHHLNRTSHLIDLKVGLASFARQDWT